MKGAENHAVVLVEMILKELVLSPLVALKYLT